MSGDDQLDLNFLENFKAFWIQFCIQMQSTKDIFLYLERTHLLRDHSSFWLIGLNQVQEGFKVELKQRLKEGVLGLIHEDRIDEKRTKRYAYHQKYINCIET